MPVIAPLRPYPKRVRGLSCACTSRLQGFLGYCVPPSTAQEWATYSPTYNRVVAGTRYDSCTGLSEWDIGQNKMNAQQQMLAALQNPPPIQQKDSGGPITLTQIQTPTQNQGSSQDTGIGNKTTPSDDTASILESMAKVLTALPAAPQYQAPSGGGGSNISVSSGSDTPGSSFDWAGTLDKEKYYLLGALGLAVLGIYFFKRKPKRK